jgi:arsenate reductase
MQRVLFVCVRNSARSQMAEALLRRLDPEGYQVASAGLRPTGLLPEAVEVLREVGIDISDHPTQSVFALLAQGQRFDHLIILCQEEQARQCPDFPPPCQRQHWCFDEPSAFVGAWEERLAQTRRVRDQIESALRSWLRGQAQQAAEDRDAWTKAGDKP